MFGFAPGFEGYLCEVDIDECRHNDPCINSRCVNSPGSYNCICDNDDDCGKHCDRKDPCKNVTNLRPTLERSLKFLCPVPLKRFKKLLVSLDARCGIVSCGSL